MAVLPLLTYTGPIKPFLRMTNYTSVPFHPALPVCLFVLFCTFETSLLLLIFAYRYLTVVPIFIGSAYPLYFGSHQAFLWILQ